MSRNHKGGTRVHVSHLGSFGVPVALPFAVLDYAERINPEVAYAKPSTDDDGVLNGLRLLADKGTRAN